MNELKTREIIYGKGNAGKGGLFFGQNYEKPVNFPKIIIIIS